MQSWLQKHTAIEEKDFPVVANLLLNQTVLMVKGVPHRICEIEFYLKSKEHLDLYTHGCSVQEQWGAWYFHRCSGGGYKGGTFKGLDITVGNPKEGSHGGILIRSIFAGDTNTPISGPCLTVNHILERYGAPEIKDLVPASEVLSVLKNKWDLILLDTAPGISKETLYSGPRVGLSEKYPEFRSRNYRYAIGIKNIKKDKRSLVPLKG